MRKVGGVPVNSADNQPGTIAILRVDENGKTVWKKTLGGPSFPDGKYDGIRATVQAGDPGRIVIGETESITGEAIGDHGKSDIIIGKLVVPEISNGVACTGGRTMSMPPALGKLLMTLCLS
jgi:hypothetical protein